MLPPSTYISSCRACPDLLKSVLTFGLEVSQPVTCQPGSCWSTLDAIILERLSGSLLHTHPAQSKDVILHTTRLLTQMLPYSLNSCLAFRPCSGPQDQPFFFFPFTQAANKLINTNIQQLICTLVCAFVGRGKSDCSLSNAPCLVCLLSSWRGWLRRSQCINSWCLKRPLIL